MFSLPVRDVMQQEKFLTAAPTTTVTEAAKLMADDNAGAIVVVDGDKLLGIFTKRDAVYRIIARGLDPDLTTMSQAMTPNPRTVESSSQFGWALRLMSANGLHHLPVVENGHAIGILTNRKVFDPELEQFVSETARRHHYSQPSSRK